MMFAIIILALSLLTGIDGSCTTPWGVSYNCATGKIDGQGIGPAKYVMAKTAEEHVETAAARARGCTTPWGTSYDCATGKLEGTANGYVMAKTAEEHVETAAARARSCMTPWGESYNCATGKVDGQGRGPSHYVMAKTAEEHAMPSPSGTGETVFVIHLPRQQWLVVLALIAIVATLSTICYICAKQRRGGNRFKAVPIYATEDEVNLV